ncbi:MAG: hypothetical protein MZV64_58410 [Ignavibacteriales bacterium]|nr:hypothetical protein [Ignavibacteriales bacterium]
MRRFLVKIKSANKYSAGKVLTRLLDQVKYSGAAISDCKISSQSWGLEHQFFVFRNPLKSFVHKNLSEVVLQEYADNGKEFFRVENLEELSGK